MPINERPAVDAGRRCRLQLDSIGPAPLIRALGRLHRWEQSDANPVKLYMKRQLVLLAVIVVTVASTGNAWADYSIGEFRGCLATATHVVDATVTAITKERHARLEVHRHIKGTNAPAVLTGTALSCTHEPPGAFGMQAGKRYIIMLRDARLYEETTFFEVTKREDGSAGCRLSDFHKRWFGVSSAWVSLEEMTKLMTPQKQ